MRYFFTLRKLALPALLLLAACQNLEAPTPELQEVTIEQIQVAEDARLNRLLAEQLGAPSQGRTLNSPFGPMDLDQAIRVEDPSRGIIRYSLLLRSESNATGFDNFVLKVQEGQASQYVLSYLPDDAWWAENYPAPNWQSYTGSIIAYSPDGAILAEDYLVEGASQTKGTKQGRVQECYSCKFEIKESTITGNQYVEVNCDDGSDFILFRRDCGDTVEDGESGSGETTGGGSTGAGDDSGGTEGGDLTGGSVGSGGDSSGDFEGIEPDPIGILPPPDMLAFLDDKIANTTDPETLRKLQLQYISTHNAEEGRQFKEIIEELLTTPGLTVGEVADINAAVDRYYKQLKGQYLIAIFAPVAETAKPFIELALFETGSGVLFQALKGLLSVRWGVQLAKIGLETTSISSLTTRMVNAVKIAANQASVSLKIGGRNLTGIAESTTSSSKVAYNFTGVNTTEVRAIFQEMTAGRIVKRVEMGEGKWRETIHWMDSNNIRNSITLRNFSKTGKLGDLIINVDMPIIREGVVELKFFL